IKLEDLSKLVQNVPTDFIDLESQRMIVSLWLMKVKKRKTDKGIHVESKFETKYTSVPRPLSPRSIQLKEQSSSYPLVTKEKIGA
ncbi:hypothetical protein Tco_0460490, partial [Tanacetum coccineum]